MYFLTCAGFFISRIFEALYMAFFCTEAAASRHECIVTHAPETAVYSG